jgi:hypothetical protein
MHGGTSYNIDITKAENIISGIAWKKVISGGIEMEKINN